MVVLGTNEESDSVLQTLETHQVQFTHLDQLGALSSHLEQHAPDLALVIGDHFQQQDQRLEIQRLVGSRPCLVLYIDTSDHHDPPTA